MHVFVSWAFLSKAEDADVERERWIAKAKDSTNEEDKTFVESLTQKACFPELNAYNELLEKQETTIKLDELNSDILAIRFIVPGLSEIKTYKLSGRLDGSKLPVSLAARAFLLNNFVGEWTSDLNIPGFNKITFVGLPGLGDFLKYLAYSCGSFGEALPVDLWCKTQQIEIAKDDKEIRKLIEACAFNQKTEEERQKYKNLLTGWFGTGTSAERDGDLLITVAMKLGFMKVITRN